MADFYGVSRPLLLGSLLAGCVFAQQSAPEASAGAKPRVEPGTPAAQSVEDKRVFGVLPNYRTADDTKEYEPLSVRRKFYIGYKDSFDYPVYPLTAVFAGLYQWEDSNPSYGQGMKGYAKRYASAYADQVIGNMMAESLFPAILHEDPRYFRHPEGTSGARLRYALTRVFVTRTDIGGSRFNLSEVLGNASAVAIANTYSRDSRNVSDNVTKLGQQFAVDAFSNVLKEFWPDAKRRYFSKKEKP